MQDLINQLVASQTRSEPIYQAPEGWIIGYPKINELADEQLHAFWPWNEPKVENDIQDLRVHLNDNERNGVLEVLKSFTLYEMKAGEDFWTGRFMNTFKRPEFQRLGSINGAAELNSHAPFYNRINEVLFVDNEEFYTSWKADPILVERMKCIDDIVNCDDDLVTMGGFTFIEGVSLYSQFAYLKHFQTQQCGKDYIKQINRGIDQSSGDENLHSLGAALTFNILKEERKLSKHLRKVLEHIMIHIAELVYLHEEHIISKIFKDGGIRGITAKNMTDFVKHRINLCLNNLGIKDLYDNSNLDGFIASWFYEGISGVSSHDFFTGHSKEYHTNWDEHKFDVWTTSNVAEIRNVA